MTAADHIEDWLTPPEWHNQAACTFIGGDEWFPEKGGTTREAKKVCATCPVQNECLQYALDHDERYGVWGGLSERDRRKLQRSAAR